jgi:hypothetical protein
MGGACSSNGRDEERVEVIDGIEGKRPLGRPGRGWVDNGCWRDRMGLCGLVWSGSG